MDLSIFLAKVFGLYMTAGILAVLVNKAAYRKVVDDLSRDTVSIVFSGSLVLVLGLLVVLSHNVWSPDWRVLITLLGWLAVGKGLVRIFAPGFVGRWAKKVELEGAWIAVLVGFLVLGLYLTVIGFTL